MSRSVVSPIEYLVGRRFPGYRGLEFPLSPAAGRPFFSGEDRLEQQREVQAYRASLSAKTAEELAAMVDREKTMEAQLQRSRIEREEQERSFNKPRAKADFAHWSKAAYWTHDEAVALAFGKSPELVTWKVVEPYVNVSPLARDYARLRDLVVRAKDSNQLFEPVLPSLFLAWARRMDVVVPEELIQAVEARGILVADWKDLYDRQKSLSDMLLEDRDKIADMARQLTKQRDVLKRRVEELHEQVSGWQFDEEDESYPAELDIAMQAWRTASRHRDATTTAKQQILTWLKHSYPKLSAEARERIATLCNWEKQGGRRPQSQ